MPGLQTYLDMYTSGSGARAPGGLNQSTQGLGAPSAGGNPFAALLQGLGGAGAGAGGVPGTPASAPKFNAFLDPSRNDLGGFLGRLTGAPTREEYWMQRQGQASQAGMAGLAERVQQGMPPQQAVLDFINSPEGMDFFTTVPNAADEIKKQLALMAGPEPQDMINVAPGGAVFDPNTGQQAFSNPTTEVQDFTGLAEVAGLSKDEMATLAQAALVKKQTGDLTQTQEATANLVARGLITPEMKDKIDGGVLQIQPMLGADGSTEGHVIIDMTDPTNPTAILPTGGLTKKPVQPGSPNYAPGSGSDDGYDPYASVEPGTYLAEFANPADIVEGAGMVPALTETMGGLADIIVPGATGWGAEAAKKRRALDQIKNDARSLKDSGRYLKSDIALLDSILPSTSSFSSQSYTQAAESLIQYRLWLEQRAALATAVYGDPEATNKARGEAKLELIQLDKAMANVPTVDQLDAKVQELKVKYKDISPAGEAIGNAIKSGTQVEQTGEQMMEQGTMSPVKTDFKDEAEARKAVEANPEAYNGKRVTIGGVPMTVGVANPEGYKKPKQPYTGGPK